MKRSSFPVGQGATSARPRHLHLLRPTATATLHLHPVQVSQMLLALIRNPLMPAAVMAQCRNLNFNFQFFPFFLFYFHFLVYLSNFVSLFLPLSPVKSSLGTPGEVSSGGARGLPNFLALRGRATRSRSNMKINCIE